MKASIQNSTRRAKATTTIFAIAVAAASLPSAALINAAEAKHGGGKAQMTGAATSQSQRQIDRVGSTRAPAPTSAQKPCKPSPHCRPPHDHSHD